MRIVHIFTILGVALSGLTLLRPFDINVTFSDILFIFSLFFIAASRWPLTNNFLKNGFRLFWIVSVSLFFMGFLIVAFKGDSIRFLVSSLQYLFCFFAVPYVLSYTHRKEPHLFYYAIGLMILLMSAVSLLSLYSRFGGSVFLQSYGLQMTNFRYQGLSGNPNRFSSLLVLYIPLIFGIKYLGYASNKFLIITVFCFLIGLMAASSFGGIITFVVTLLAMAVINFGFKPLLKYVAFGAIISSVIIFTGAVPEVFVDRVFSHISGGAYSYMDFGSANTRIDVSKEAWSIISQNPIIGLGLDNYLDASSFSHTVHNTTLLVWAEGGIISFIGLLLVCFTPIIYYIALPRRFKSREAMSVVVGFTVALLATTQVFAHIYSRAWFVPFFLLIFLLNDLSRKNAEP